jgi:N-acyl-D-aspartate/D-glutamate deacylase
MLDLVVRRGWVVPGDGTASRRADVAVARGRIVAVEPVITAAATTEIDARDRYVFSAFVDVHSHTDESALRPRAHSKLLQGIGTEICGQCGGSAVPLSTEAARAHRRRIKLEEDGWYPDEEWNSFPELFAAMGRGVPCNFATFVGWWTIHDDVVRFGGGDVDAALVTLAKVLDGGAAGLSIHQESDSWMTLSASDRRCLFAVVACRDLPVSVHLAHYDERLPELIGELFSLVAATGARLQLSHIKILGKRPDRLLASVVALFDSNKDVPFRFDVTAFPSICTRARLFAAKVAAGRRGRIFLEQFDAIHGLSHGWRLRRGPSGWTAADVAELVRRVTADPGELVVAGGLNSDTITQLLAHPRCFIGSDASAAPSSARPRCHERAFETFPVAVARRLRYGAKVAEVAVQTSAEPCRWFRLAGRGTIAWDQRADLTVLDIDGDNIRVADVIVNGTHCVAAGMVIDDRAGEVLTVSGGEQ